MDSIQINWFSYVYYKELSKSNKDEMKTIINEITNQKFAESDTKDLFLYKYDKSEYHGFKLEDLLKRFSCIRLDFSSHPERFTDPNKQRFFNVPIFKNSDGKAVFYANDKALADKKLEETKQQFTIKDSLAGTISVENNNMYLTGEAQKIYIDTISYDPWQQCIDDLERLCVEINKNANVDEKGYIQFQGQNEIKGADAESGEEAEEPVKLCNKIFPMDIFGVTGLLGLDDLLAKFGLKSNIKTYISDTQGPCSYKKIASALSKACNGKDIASIKFSDIEKTSEYKIEKSIVSQFRNEDLEDFKKAYVAASSNKKELEQTFEKNVKVGIIDGYFMYPAGVFIDFEFVLSEYAPKLKGTILAQSAALYALASNYGTTGYESAVKSTYKAIFPLASSLNALPLNARIFLGFPFKPDLDALLGGDAGKIEVSSAEGDEMVFYIPEPDTVKTFVKTFLSGKPATIRFNVYFKSPIICQYPKCEGKEGKCGLQELLEKPVKLDNMVSFDLEKRLKQITSNAKRKALIKEDMAFKENVTTIGESAWNIGKNLLQSSMATNNALDILYSLGTAFTPLLEMLPLNCIVNAAGDGKNAICSASRQARDISAIEENDVSMMHTINTVGIVAKDACSAFTEHVKSSFESIANAGESMLAGVKGLINNASIYDLCERRFRDYVADSGIGKGIMDGVNQLMTFRVSDIFKGILGSCVTNGIIDTVTNSLDGLNESAKGEVGRLLQFGDINSLKELGKKYPQMIEKFGDGKGGLDIQSISNKAGFDMNLLPKIQAEFIKRMNPMSMAQGALQQFISPANLIDFAKKGATSFIKNGPGNLGSMMMDSIKGISLDSMSNQLGVNAETLLGATGATNLAGNALTNAIDSAGSAVSKATDSLGVSSNVTDASAKVATGQNGIGTSTGSNIGSQVGSITNGLNGVGSNLNPSSVINNTLSVSGGVELNEDIQNAVDGYLAGLVNGNNEAGSKILKSDNNKETEKQSSSQQVPQNIFDSMNAYIQEKRKLMKEFS
jgi:hypothetical protein